ncbi:hypothetical protein U9M48_033992, partial [Paspalum notatum var. saurae]
MRASSAASIASDTLSNGGNITDGETLVSSGGSFTMGFFSPTGVPAKRYLGIWFTASPDAVCWVANRDTPLNTTSGVLVMGTRASLRLLDGSGQAAWSSNSTSSAAAVAQLLDSGNLVVRDQSSGAVLWQSFDHPSNTLLAGMRLGKDPRTGVEWSLTSWRAPNDPTPGDCRRVMDTRGLPDCVSWQGSVKKYRTGPWNGLWFSGVPEMASYSELFSNQVVVRPDEVAYIFNATAGAPFSRLVLNEVGVLQRLAWDPASRVWNVFAQAPRDVCDDYAMCGAFGLCNVNTASTLFCSCVMGFSPMNPTQWSMRESGGGCWRNAPLECGNGTTTDGFMVVRGVKLPDADNTTVDMGATLEQCRARCLANCSCVAYAAADIRGGGDGSGCVMWTNYIVDVRYVDRGQDLYVRLAKSELANDKNMDEVKIVIPVAASLLVLAAAGMYLVWICRLRGRHLNRDIQKKAMLNELGDENLELPFVSFGDIIKTTNNFSEGNMLGQGGFGKVYKGMLDENKEVAIKRLGQSSGQGAEEFKNEVVLIAKLQHRNLVRLIGFCIYGDEKLLIYEYLPNKSLDSFIFDAASKKVLDWPTRFKIIKGISRGLLYLHRDSRLTIIHRDLKPSNILLDADMSPKISDFGMARIFGGNQHEANTNRVVGTYGYMSPEYAMDGAFSVKSDTYSFGVILLEIISGLRISLTHITDFPNLLAYAWSLWNEGKAMDLLDSSFAGSCSPNEALRCIHIGLLCVQDNPNSRPLMSSAVFMLENETTSLPVPNQPVYFSQKYSSAQETGDNTSSSMKNMSMTVGEMGTICLTIFILLLLFCFCKSDDQLTSARPLTPGDLLVSKGGVFASGFFSPAGSDTSLYVGIWFHGIPERNRTIVWVANRDSPATTASSPTLAIISNSSDLVLSDSKGNTLWRTQNITSAHHSGTRLVLLDTGNLVLQLPDGTVMWQSFDHPTDTILPGMKFLMIHKARAAGRLVSWRGTDDPSTGDFSFGLDPIFNLQMMIWHGTKPYCRISVWNGVSASGGMYTSNSSSIVYQTIVNTGDEFYLVYTVSDNFPYSRIMLDHTGTMKLLRWDSTLSSWMVTSERPTGGFGLYDSCGPNGYCDFTGAAPACHCLEGYEPIGLNSSRGCRRTKPLQCSKGSHFVSLPGMRVPDKFVLLRNRSFEQCAAECSRNCSCTAYAYANLSSLGAMANQSRCLVWTGELVDTWKSSNYDENLYLRLSDPPVKMKTVKIVVPVIACLLLSASIALVWICRFQGKWQKKEIQKKMMLGYLNASNELGDRNVEFPFVSFDDIVHATDNFSDCNMLGRGGFGKVYKGMLEGGKEVAVKRLSQGSWQGIDEFRNEVVLLVKLQHRNLVRLLGCCIHEEEKLLIYEYLPNKNLDAFLFDASREHVLDWPTRFKIIKGISKGLLYLHQDSRLTIIHRDLKASNILLDTEMNPKISDFGMARIFGGNEQLANTTRVVGTYGYMAPEYVTSGAFSVKSDTYSFGVLLLEIISGLKIISSQISMDFPNLISYTWKLWEDGNVTELVDPSVAESCPLHEVLRCIHVGLLCVQDNPNARPLMSSVVFMLENETILIPAPKEPVYFVPRNNGTEETRSNMEGFLNTSGITTLEGCSDSKYFYVSSKIRLGNSQSSDKETLANSELFSASYHSVNDYHA